MPGQVLGNCSVHSTVLSVPPGSLCSVSIEKALPEDRGLYKCVAKNGAGQAECSCQVTVDGRSYPPIATTRPGSHLSHPPTPAQNCPQLSSPLPGHSFGRCQATFGKNKTERKVPVLLDHPRGLFLHPCQEEGLFTLSCPPRPNPPHPEPSAGSPGTRAPGRGKDTPTGK